MKTLIVVPARYGSTRFPGKPLARLAGRTLISRVALRARAAAAALDDATAAVATDDERIATHARELGIEAIMTDPDLPSGSDRALAAARGLNPAFVVNLQGDAPFTPIDYLTSLIAALEAGDADAATPCIRLSWAALDAFREAKKTTPFSGTTCIVGPSGRALWFSKNIIPAMRDEGRLREESAVSPVRRHVGVYAYRLDALRRMAATPPSAYERIEGLEQLRLIEAGGVMACVDVEPTEHAISGIDTPEDLAAAEALVRRLGDPDRELFQ